MAILLTYEVPIQKLTKRVVHAIEPTDKTVIYYDSDAGETRAALFEGTEE